jgi:hypothetical protein
MLRPILVSIAGAVLLAALEPAQSQSLLLCLQQCNGVPECGGDSPESCASARGLCESQCQLSGGRSGGGAVRKPLPLLHHGAIVYDMPTGRWGKAWGHSNGQTAFKAAQSECFKAGGRQCDVTAPIQEGCVVLAMGDDGKGFVGYQKSGGKEAYPYARSHAIAACTQGGGDRCRQVAGICSWGEPAR